MAELPKRTAKELALALRVRASLLSGEAWETPATAAMMEEAADLLDASLRFRADLEGLVTKWDAEEWSGWACVSDLKHWLKSTAEG